MTIWHDISRVITWRMICVYFCVGIVIYCVFYLRSKSQQMQVKINIMSSIKYFNHEIKLPLFLLLSLDLDLLLAPRLTSLRKTKIIRALFTSSKLLIGKKKLKYLQRHFCHQSLQSLLAWQMSSSKDSKCPLFLPLFGERLLLLLLGIVVYNIALSKLT